MTGKLRGYTHKERDFDSSIKQDGKILKKDLTKTENLDPYEDIVKKHLIPSSMIGPSDGAGRLRRGLESLRKDVDILKK